MPHPCEPTRARVKVSLPSGADRADGAADGARETDEDESKGADGGGVGAGECMAVDAIKLRLR